ncbi:MAG: NfeD family protein [Gammaproteobacteria bacterium]
MPWWGWMIFGAFLLGSELLGVEAGFYLVFIGVAAALTGFIEVAGFELEQWTQWIVFAVLGLLLMVFFRKKLYQKLRGGGIGYDASPTGDFIKLEETLQPGEKGRVSYRGTSWTVFNAGSEVVGKGVNVQISSVEGLTLKINDSNG